jgi:SSS family solute:Na+ symporter
MSHLYVAVLAVIVVVLLSVALYRSSQVKTKADYLVAGRSLPAIVLVLTLLTSWIGAGSLFAGAENAYRNGFAALWQPAGGWLGLLLIYFIAPRARKFAQFTLPDLLEARYNQTARVLGTFAILFAYVGITSYQFKGGGNVLHLIFPDTVTPDLGAYIIAAFVIVTTALAGCGHWLAGHRHLHHRHADAVFQGGRMDRATRRAAGVAFPGAGQPDLCARSRISGSDHAADVGQPGDVSEVFLG